MPAWARLCPGVSHHVDGLALAPARVRVGRKLDENNRSSAGQMDDVADNDRELNNGKLTNLLDDVTEVDDDEKVTANCNPRVLATEAGLGTHINSDAAATNEQAHVRGGDEDGVVDQEKLSRMEVALVVNKVVYPIGLLAPTLLKHEGLLPMLTKAGLEEKLPANPEKPDTGDPKLGEFPDQGVLVELEGWRRKLQRLSQHNDIRELKQRLEAGACAPPPRELFPHTKKLTRLPRSF